MCNGWFLIHIYDILITYHICMYAQRCIHISLTKTAYNYEESIILFYNYITLSASYGHVTFIATSSVDKWLFYHSNMNYHRTKINSTIRS